MELRAHSFFNANDLPALLLERIDYLLSQKERVCIALDGRCCAGKTTLAAVLESRYAGKTVHMDHFFLPPELRTEVRHHTPGGNVHYERFLEEVSPHLNTRGAFSYRAYDCQTGTCRSIHIEDTPLLTVEGSYSHHPLLSRTYDLRVFLTLSKEAQWERLKVREIPEKLPQFQSAWLPMEDLYFSNCDIAAQADLVLTTGIQ